jgi:hypothetical protein
MIENEIWWCEVPGGDAELVRIVMEPCFWRYKFWVDLVADNGQVVECISLPMNWIVV